MSEEGREERKGGKECGREGDREVGSVGGRKRGKEGKEGTALCFNYKMTL